MRSMMIAAILVPFAANALETPEPGKVDPHIRQIAFNALNRTNLVGEIGRQTTITFSEDEQVFRISLGDRNEKVWSGPSPDEIKEAPLRNILPLWPVTTDPTNLQVTTILPDRTQRVYQFALSAKEPLKDGTDDPDVTFGLIFTYPEKAKQKAVNVQQQQTSITNSQVSKARLAVDVSYGKRNWAYVARPNKAWRNAEWPTPEVSDNGMLTAFSFTGSGTPQPAAYIVDKPDEAADPKTGLPKCEPGGEERLPPFSNKDGLMIIPTTAKHFRLRLGNAVMEVCNAAWNPGVDADPHTGTTSPDVFREIIYSK